MDMSSYFTGWLEVWLSSRDILARYLIDCLLRLLTDWYLTDRLPAYMTYWLISDRETACLDDLLTDIWPTDCLFDDLLTDIWPTDCLLRWLTDWYLTDRFNDFLLMISANRLSWQVFVFFECSFPRILAVTWKPALGSTRIPIQCTASTVLK